MKIKKSLKLFCLFLSLILLLTSISSLEAHANKKSIMDTEKHELFKETIFVVKKKAHVRSVPYRDHGESLGELVPGEIITANSYEVNIHNNAWICFTFNNRTAYYYSENLSIHDEHSYCSLESQGFPFHFCSVCGKVKNIEDIYSIPLSGVESEHEKLHICLTILSLVPVVGNLSDTTEGLLYLYEGNTTEALLAFASIIPIGETVELLKYHDEFTLILKKTGFQYTDELIETVNTAGVVVNKTDTKVSIRSIPNSSILGRNMDDAFFRTGEARYYKNIDDGKWSWAAHHIVAADEPRADIARNVLRKFSIDPNSEVNGVYLPIRQGISDGSLHNGAHTANYYSTINVMLSRCETREEVEDVLNIIANLLMEGKLSL